MYKKQMYLHFHRFCRSFQENLEVRCLPKSAISTSKSGKNKLDRNFNLHIMQHRFTISNLDIMAINFVNIPSPR